MSDFKQVKETVTYILKNNFKRQNIVLLHCNTEYPTPYKDVNLRAMIEMKNKLKIKNFGYSDHTLGTLVPLASVAMGANYIEKHFTLNKKYKGPDHKASMEPHEFKEMMNKIRLLEKILGSKQKIITNSEKKNFKIARKSIVASIKIKKGEKFSENNLAIKRPAYGMKPSQWFKLLGKKAKRNYSKDQYIK